MTAQGVNDMSRKLRLALAIGFFLFVTLAAVFPERIGSYFSSTQIGAAIVGLVAGVSFVGLAVVILGAVTALIFGRLFCSIICPFGSFQEMVGLVCSKRRIMVPNLRIVRYGFAIAAFSLLVAGTAAGFRILDPFARFGSMVSAIQTLGSHYIFSGSLPYVPYVGFTTIILIVTVSVWKRRLFCVAICPVGTILGLCAKFSIFGMRVTTLCVACGRCESYCPTGCISISNRRIDNERCVLCLNCLSRCPTKAIVYSPRRSTPLDREMSQSRRRFLVTAASATMGTIAIGYGLRNPLRALTADDKEIILPPGANDADMFERLCIGCLMCVAACPNKVIRPGAFGVGMVSLNFNIGKCDYECNHCTQVCPTGALQSLSLADKQWLKIGEAAVEAAQCKVTHGEQCDLCEMACPKEAIFMIDDPSGLKAPEVSSFHCIGCGACQAICPTQPKAITVKSVREQSF